MARSIWRGAISFGLVNVPVKLYSAVSKKTVRFNQLHDVDGVRIQMKRVCPADGDEVPYENLVKGYEVSPDRYVVITPEELKSLDAEKTRTIDIEDFVDLEQIDPLYYDHPYYLAPDVGAAKAYGLLLAALKQSGKVAIARFVMREKEYLAAIRAADGVLTLETMIFADELVSPSQLEELPEAKEVKVTKREVEMAQQLIDSLSTGFDPAKYKDSYRERVLDLIERKSAGEVIAAQPEPPERKQVPDLMEALEASIANAKKRKKPAAKRPAARSKAKPKPKTKPKAETRT
ncbi:MAG: Ku protein [Solirubrobacterales bacterium]